MRFYQELQLNHCGSKELIRESKTTKEKLYQIAVYLFKIAMYPHNFFCYIISILVQIVLLYLCLFLKRSFLILSCLRFTVNLSL